MPIVAIVDPEMMSSMPAGLTASTGMDALTHAIEGYTTKAAWEMTDMFHLEAIKLISTYLRGAVKGTKGRPRGYGSRPVYCRHGLLERRTWHRPLHAHTLGAVYDTPHGVACAMMLPIVMNTMPTAPVRSIARSHAQWALRVLIR